MKKALVIGVILLFLGVGFQPALANEVSITETSDVDEDCLECQPVNRVDLLKVKLLLIRLEAITNVILSKYGHIPEVEEKCQEISENISILKELKEGLNPVLPYQDIPPICYILIPLFIVLMTLVEWFPHSEIPILKQILTVIMLTITAQFLIVLSLNILFDCLPPGPDS